MNPGTLGSGISDIPDAAVDLLTSGVHVAHLATSHEDRPHVAAVWYVYHEAAIELVTTGKKLENIRRNPRVALSVEHSEDGAAKWGVTMLGTATVVTDETEGCEILHRINSRYGAAEDEYAENTPVRIDVGSVDHWIYRRSRPSATGLVPEASPSSSC